MPLFVGKFLQFSDFSGVFIPLILEFWKYEFSSKYLESLITFVIRVLEISELSFL